jgi:tetratricopeptide (TPR) repeat protein
MYNLLYSLGIAVVLYVLTSLVADDWVAGILPALLGLGVGYFVLARRTFKKFEKIATGAVAELQTVQSDPSALERAKAQLKSALPLAKWQFLIEQQIHGQLGQLCYMGDTMRQQRDHSEARAHLEKAWSRDWTSQLTLAVIEYKAGDKDQALKRLDDAQSSGSGQIIYWGVWAWMAHERKQTDKALKVLADAIKKHEKAEALIGMRDAIANKRTVDVTLFGQTWFQFFPEHFQKLPPAKQMELMGANAPQMNRAQRRAMKRGKGGVQQPANGPMRPHPRR